ncbi:down syndrome cell adhesion molecule-like protein Dscam2 [Caerostris extrusa]|uniref:Down syndrome cell adhesion molecule-like protein Dscam2 n=1 Tax=Caerostris extrusa TaxID=172846 RepID=A0AAV4Y717_CAEEX|nr:down syndrome cell adhesion molecule-like protein Dscam2 [Caerostris extrusa]
MQCADRRSTNYYKMAQGWYDSQQEDVEHDESSMGHLGSALVFNSVGRSHNGNYTCLAENAAGESNFTATMLVNGDLTSEVVIGEQNLLDTTYENVQSKVH